LIKQLYALVCNYFPFPIEFAVINNPETAKQVIVILTVNRYNTTTKELKVKPKIIANERLYDCKDFIFKGLEIRARHVHL
jgi:hypothetical protein